MSSLDSKNFTKYLGRHEIEATVVDIANRLNKDYEGKDVVIVTVLKGGLIFAADLIRHLNFNPKIEFVRLVSHGKSKETIGTVSFLKDIQTDIRGKHVLILEQIIDSGRTLQFLYDRLKKSEPASLEIVTLLDKAQKRLIDTEIKYAGRTVSDQFLVGYGLDLEEKCRNLADIFYLRYPN